MAGQRTLLITPPYHAGVVEVAGRWVPLGTACLAGAARGGGHEPIVYDAMTKMVGHDEIRKVIEETRPDVVAVSAITATCPDALEVFQTAKDVDSEIVTVAGGVHASFMYEEMFESTKELDYVVIGEGERILVELLDCLDAGGTVGDVRGIARRENGGVVRTPGRPFIVDLDEVQPAWDLLDWEDYTYFIIPGSRLGAIDTTRGCQKACTFCSQHKLWERSWRARSPNGVVEQMTRMRDEHGVDVVLFTDDYPTPDRDHWEELLDLLIEKDLGTKILMETRAEDIVRDADILAKYRRAGIVHIYVGTEATDQATLDLIKKDLDVNDSQRALDLCREHNIITETSMILGFPDDTPASISRTIDLAIEYDPDFAHFLAITPWPYADIYPDLEPFVEDFDYRKYNLVEPIVKPKAMTRKEVDEAIIEGYRRFYMGKFKEMLESGDEFKREYMLNAMRRMMNNSFIKKKLGSLGGAMPEEIREIVEGEDEADVRPPRGCPMHSMTASS